MARRGGQGPEPEVTSVTPGRRPIGRKVDFRGPGQAAVPSRPAAETPAKRPAEGPAKPPAQGPAKASARSRAKATPAVVPVVSEAALRRAALAGRGLLAVIAVQCLGLVAVAVLVATRLGSGRVAPVAGDLVAALGGAVVIGLLGRSVARGVKNARGALVTIEVLCVPVGVYAVQGGRPEVGIPVAVLGALALAGIFVVAATLADVTV